jgi:tripartite-type tricarboxylate transporter receptor subunit TctC
MQLRSFLAACSVGAVFAASGLAGAQEYPTRPIRIVTGEVGGVPDIVARLIGPALTARLGKPIVVDNRGGGNGAIAAQAVARAAPDGHTLLFYASALWLAPLMNGVQEDPLKDFAPVSLVASAPNIVVVHPSLPVKSVRELIALAKARPRALNYASGGLGSSPHLAGELFNAMAGVEIVRIGYKGGGPAINDLIAGNVQLMFAAAGSVAEHVKAGRLRALALTSAQPSELAPGLPTVAASGLPGFITLGLYPVFAPGETPAALVNRIREEIHQAVQRADVRERLLRSGIEPAGGTPEELATLLKTEITRWGQFFRARSIPAG